MKCDRQASGCGACARLDFSCSYIASEAAVSATVRDLAASDSLTQAGTKRKRTRKACNSCRAVKAKCSGQQPCSRCNSLLRSCQYPEGGAHPIASCYISNPDSLSSLPSVDQQGLVTSAMDRADSLSAEYMGLLTPATALNRSVDSLT